MNKNVKLVLTLSSVAILLCSCRGGRGRSSSDVPTSVDPGTSIEPATSSDPGDYYASINSSLMGQDLINALNGLNNTKRTYQVGYDAMMNKPAQGFYVTDPGASGEKTRRKHHHHERGIGPRGAGAREPYPMGTHLGPQDLPPLWP